MNKKDKFVRKIHSELDQWNNEIDALVKRAEEAEEEIETEFHQQIEALRK